jgi:hypothetical protein
LFAFIIVFQKITGVLNNRERVFADQKDWRTRNGSSTEIETCEEWVEQRRGPRAALERPKARTVAAMPQRRGLWSSNVGRGHTPPFRTRPTLPRSALTQCSIPRPGARTFWMTFPTAPAALEVAGSRTGPPEVPAAVQRAATAGQWVTIVRLMLEHSEFAARVRNPLQNG